MMLHKSETDCFPEETKEISSFQIQLENSALKISTACSASR